MRRCGVPGIAGRGRYVGGLGLSLLTPQCMAPTAPALNRHTVGADGNSILVDQFF